MRLVTGRVANVASNTVTPVSQEAARCGAGPPAGGDQRDGANEDRFHRIDLRSGVAGPENGARGSHWHMQILSCQANRDRVEERAADALSLNRAAGRSLATRPAVSPERRLPGSPSLMSHLGVGPDRPLPVNARSGASSIKNSRHVLRAGSQDSAPR